MISWFQKKEFLKLKADVHSHLLPGIDDGVRDFEEALAIIRFFTNCGYQKLITTPHVYQDHYPNTATTILDAYGELQKVLQSEGVSVEVEVAAEYFIDDHLLTLLNNHETVLSFGQEKYVLIETAFYTKPIIFDEVVFKLKSQGFIPVLAHPERYFYLENDLSWLKRIRQNGVKLQVSLPSLVAAYGPEVKNAAKQILKESMVDFFGSDIHNLPQTAAITASLRKKYYPQNILNNELI